MTRDRPAAPPLEGTAPRDRSAVAATRRLVLPSGVLVLAGVVVGYVAVIDPNQGGNYPTCPFLSLTGCQCPGCGSLRTIHALAHGDMREALGLNLFAVAMLPVLAFFWGRWTVARARGRPARTRAG